MIDASERTADSRTDPAGAPLAEAGSPLGVVHRSLSRTKVLRVKDRNTFSRLRRGRKSPRGVLQVSWVPGAEVEGKRVAFSVGRAVGNAVVRNQMRRRLREIVRQEADWLPAGSFLVSVSPAANALPFEDLRTSLTQAMRAVPGIERMSAGERASAGDRTIGSGHRLQECGPPQ